MPIRSNDLRLGKYLGEAFEAAIAEVGPENIFRNCSKCEHWREPSSGAHGCALYQAIPPVRIIVVGCDSFKDTDEIPF